MMRSLYSGVAGLKTHQTRMDVIGNNIANVNTTAFKSSAVSFQDIMYQTTSAATGATENLGGKNAKQIGLGVTTGATKLSITAGGSAQSTGDALDIKLTDARSTNFFIVNNGAENVFTRSGSFYLDSNGNLAMTTTGYLVQGWQAVTDPVSGNRSIQRDTVSALRINSVENQTSNPEATTEANVSGVVDKTDTNITSESGRNFTLGFYDNLGYAYTAKFSTKLLDESTGKYTVKLKNIYDSDQNDVLDQWLNMNVNPDDTTQTIDEQKEKFLAEIWGDPDSRSATSYKPSTEFTVIGNKLQYKVGKDTYETSLNPLTVTPTPITGSSQVSFTCVTDPSKPAKTKTLNDIYGAKDFPSGLTTILDGSNPDNNPSDVALTGGGAVTVNSSTGEMIIVRSETNCILQFNTADGTFSQIIDTNEGTEQDSGDTVQNMATEGTDIATLRLDVMRNVPGTPAAGQTLPTFLDGLRNIDIDFSKTENYMNGGNSTIGADRGNVDDSTVHAGKALGALTGLSVTDNGMIFGSYSNGNTVLLGQIPVAQFANASGLESLGDNCYGTTLNSGEFDGIGVVVNADGGSMSTGQLEMSNVDLAQEFTDMITTQRGFQANSRIITVSDTMIEELTNLKR